MPQKETDSQNVWFGVAMFLLGLIAGAVLTVATGNIQIGMNGQGAPTAPNVPSQPVTVTDRMTAYAAEIGVDKKSFQSCLTGNADALTAKISQQLQEGQAAGVTGTPGNILYDLRSKKARIISGAQPITNFEKNIDEMIADQNAPISDPNIQAAGTVVPVDFEKDYIKGDKDAVIAIIEYTDYECPFCHRVHPTLQAVVDKYDGKVMWVTRHYPLHFHPEAMPLAIGAECVGSLKGNDAFWKFTDKVMSE